MTGYVLMILMGLTMADLSANAQAQTMLIDASDSAFEYSGYIQKQLIASPVNSGTRMVRFDRILDMPSKGYRYDNPGTTIRFSSDASSVTALLYYNDKHISTSARNGVGVFRIDGQTVGTFNASTNTTVRPTEMVNLVMTPTTLGGTGGVHQYEIVLPYGDSVDFQGVRVSSDVTVTAPATPAPSVRYLAYGDSITHGFTASRTDRTYAYRLAQNKNWQLVNFGLGGRGSNAGDGTVVAQQNADLITILMGANDWQGQRPLATYKNNMTAMLANIRSLQPTVPVYLITPLWVAPDWPSKAGFTENITLEQYRQQLRDIAASLNDPNLHLIEGASLIDHDKAYFDPVLVHPNDAGFAQMAERLALAIPEPASLAMGLTAATALGLRRHR